MGKQPGAERRIYERYATDLKLEFQVSFEIKTKIDFRVKNKKTRDFTEKKYSAISKNISAEGLCFSSPKKLDKDDMLLLNLYVPAAKDPVKMTGKVMWSDSKGRTSPKGTVYDTGVLLLNLENKPVRETIFIDEANHVAWSNVLEAVFSNFKSVVADRKKHKK